MTPRERFLATLSYRAVDRPPLWEEGIQEDTIEEWLRQGLESEEALREEFPVDRRELVWLDLDARPPLVVGPEGPRFADAVGAFQPTPDRLPAELRAALSASKERDHPLGLVVSRGLLLSLGVGEWATLAPVLLSLYDQPEEVEALMRRIADLVVALLEQVPDLVPDYAVFSEPISSFHALVVSPGHYRRFCLPAYRRIVEALRARGVPVLMAQTYGKSDRLVPLWLELGIDTLWCHHNTAAGVDYLELRRRYGRDLKLIGGIDAGSLVLGPEAIDSALRAAAPALLEQGGYLPLLDDRVRPYVPFASYRAYRERLHRLVGLAP